MAIDGVSGNKETQKAQKTGGQKKTLSKNYHAKQEALAAKIKPQAESLSDLKNAKNVKQQQIALAQQYGDTELANTLQEELNNINKDIEKNETSIFDNKKDD